MNPAVHRLFAMLILLIPQSHFSQCSFVQLALPQSIPPSEVNTTFVDNKGVWAACSSPEGLLFRSTDSAYWAIYNVANSGIIANTVISINKDNLGNKWIGTVNGISKLDTNLVFTSFNVSLPQYVIYDIVFDSLGNMWMGMQDSGIAMYDGNVLTHYTTANSGLCCNNVWELCIDSIGNLWAATADGLSKFDGVSWTTTMDDYAVMAIEVNTNGDVWAGGVKNGTNKIFKYNGSIWTQELVLVCSALYDIKADQSGRIWFSSSNIDGLYCYNGNMWLNFNYQNCMLWPISPLYEIAVAPTNDIWVAAGFEGLIKMDQLLGEEVTEVSGRKKYLVYPNPFTNQFTVQGLQFTVEARLFNALGEFIGNWTLTTVNSKLETGNLPEGIYFLQIHEENESETIKIVLSR